MSEELLHRLRDVHVHRDSLIVLEGEKPYSWTMSLIKILQAKRRLHPASLPESIPTMKAWLQLSTDPKILTELDMFDPERTAPVIAPSHVFLNSFAGRQQLFKRPDKFAAPERKMEVDNWFDEAGLARPRSVVAVGETSELVAVWREFTPEQQPTMWSSDLGSISFGGEGVRFVDGYDIDKSAEWFALTKAPIKIAEYVQGTPVSISALVTTDDVVPLPLLAADRTVIKTVHRSTGDPTLAEFSTSTRHNADRAAIQFGELVREKLGFQGIFNIDGVVPTNSENIVAIEANMRPGAYLAYLNQTCGEDFGLWHVGAVDNLIGRDDIQRLRKAIRARKARICEGFTRTGRAAKVD